MKTLSILTEEDIRLIVGDTVRSVLKDFQPQKPNTSPGYISRNRVCDLLDISLPTLHKWINEGILKPYHIGGRTLFKENEVLKAAKPVNHSLN